MINETLAIQLRNNGHTYQSIADRLGITRQAVFVAISHKVKPHKRDFKAKAELGLIPRDYMRQHIMKVNGKYFKVNKRLYPTDNHCELCGKFAKKLDYHHWDNHHMENGIWICLPCHRFVARVEKGLHTKYMQLKELIS